MDVVQRLQTVVIETDCNGKRVCMVAHGEVNVQVPVRGELHGCRAASGAGCHRDRA